jgi:hypothetical protein
MLQALPHAVTPGPAGPDLAAADVARGHRALRQRRRRRLAGVAGTAAVGGAAVVLAATSAPWSAAPAATGTAQASGTHPASTSGTHPARIGASTGSTGAQSPLVKLAADVAADPKPVGDATLMERETTLTGQPTVKVWDLYADDGRYFFSQTKSGLPAQVKEDNTQGGGWNTREIAAAIFAVHGNLQDAALKMAWTNTTPVPAWLSSQLKNISAPGGGGQIDNYVWENSEDALVVGSGNPQVRAGVLRLVSLLPDITVTHGTLDGQPTFTLTAGAAEFGPPPSVKDATKLKLGKQPPYQEAITINADTGIPMKFVGGTPGHVGTTVNYVVTRVSLADIAAGKF